MTAAHIVVTTFYKFVYLDNFRLMRGPLLEFCRANKLRGTVLLASEGINATVAGGRSGIDKLVACLEQDPRFSHMKYKESITREFPFHRMKVKLRKEIVTMGVPGAGPDRRAGTSVAPADWNALITDPGVTVIDARNQYECDVGRFKNAVSPETATFSEFPAYAANRLDPEKHKKIAMYCTGGIRCEKASSYLLQQGFSEVYQLQGGILAYLAEVPQEESLWTGECFVFDGRITVNEELQPGIYQQCYSCRRPLSPEDRQSAKYEEGVSCPACLDQLTDARRMNLRQRQYQVRLAEQRNQQHIGAALLSGQVLTE